MPIREDAARVLIAILEYEQYPGDSKRGRYSLTPEDLHRLTNLGVDELNDAVALLEQRGEVIMTPPPWRPSRSATST